MYDATAFMALKVCKNWKTVVCEILSVAFSEYLCAIIKNFNLTQPSPKCSINRNTRNILELETVAFGSIKNTSRYFH